jgi:hypothetical protein
LLRQAPKPHTVAKMKILSNLSGSGKF